MSALPPIATSIAFFGMSGAKADMIDCPHSHSGNPAFLRPSSNLARSSVRLNVAQSLMLDTRSRTNEPRFAALPQPVRREHGLPSPLLARSDDSLAATKLFRPKTMLHRSGPR